MCTQLCNTVQQELAMPACTIDTAQNASEAPERQTYHNQIQVTNSTETTASMDTIDTASLTRFYLLVPRLHYADSLWY